MGNCVNKHLSRHGGLAVGHEDEQKKYFEEKRLYSLQIESIDACDQYCIYCYAGSVPQQKYGLTTDEILNLFKDLVDLEIRAIDWLGGDPLVRPDWYELMTKAASMGIINNVWTSGLPLADDTVAEKVLEVTDQGFVSVHIDSINPDIYHKLHPRGKVENIDRILNGVRYLQHIGKPADKMFNCIAYTSLQGPKDAIDTMNWFYDNWGMRTCLTIFKPAGEGANLRTLEPSEEEIQQVYAIRDKINYGDDGITISSMDVDKFYCGTMATVTFTGDVTQCSVIRQGVGNIRNNSFKEIVKNHLDTLVYSDFHETRNLPEPCDTCKNNSHCWGCRASAYNYSGDAFGLDPKCGLIKKTAYIYKE
jgi:radical SAM protein with 4Fe4S-binding SPASM domain